MEHGSCRVEQEAPERGGASLRRRRAGGQGGADAQILKATTGGGGRVARCDRRDQAEVSRLTEDNALQADRRLRVGPMASTSSVEAACEWEPRRTCSVWACAPTSPNSLRCSANSSAASTRPRGTSRWCSSAWTRQRVLRGRDATDCRGGLKRLLATNHCTSCRGIAQLRRMRDAAEEERQRHVHEMTRSCDC